MLRLRRRLHLRRMPRRRLLRHRRRLPKRNPSQNSCSVEPRVFNTRAHGRPWALLCASSPHGAEGSMPAISTSRPPCSG
jgi:hypothetical protein